MHQIPYLPDVFNVLYNSYDGFSRVNFSKMIALQAYLNKYISPYLNHLRHRSIIGLMLDKDLCSELATRYIFPHLPDEIIIILPSPPPPPLSSFLTNLVYPIPAHNMHPLTSTEKSSIIYIPRPQPQRSDRNMHPKTLTAKIQSQWAHLDLNRKDPITMCPAKFQSQYTPLNLNQIIY